MKPTKFRLDVCEKVEAICLKAPAHGHRKEYIAEIIGCSKRYLDEVMTHLRLENRIGRTTSGQNSAWGPPGIAKIDPIDAKLRACLEAHPDGLPRSQLEKLIGAKEEKTRNALHRLEAQGVAERSSKRPGGAAIKWGPAGFYAKFQAAVDATRKRDIERKRQQRKQAKLDAPMVDSWVYKPFRHILIDAKSAPPIRPRGPVWVFGELN